MELTPTLISLQGILTGLCKSADNLTKIKHKGGNEMKISSIVKTIRTFLIKQECIIVDEINEEITESTLWLKQHCIIEDEINERKTETVRDIVLFLGLNCEFKNELEMDGYQHLIGINLKLSTCLFANIITELRMVSFFASVLNKFPVNVQCEFLQEFLICFKKPTDGSVVLSYINSILKTVIKEVNGFPTSDNHKMNEEIESLVEVSSVILDVLKGVNVEEIQSQTKRKIYQEMGFKLFKLLELLDLCNLAQEHLSPLIKNIINICCDICAAITVDVFCEWAEVKEDGEPLQKAIGSLAYDVIAKYREYPPAKQLLTMLSAIACKPQTIQEQIRSADATKMIRMIEKEDENQKQWFQALLYTKIFSNEKSFSCIEKYHHLCDENGLERILSLCRYRRIDQRKLNLVLKCVSKIPLERLVILVTRYYRNYGIHIVLNEEYSKENLVLLLNRIEDNEFFKREILLLLFQNLREVLADLYRECLKNEVYSTHLKNIFVDFKEILIIDDVGLICLQPLITEAILCQNHVQLITLLKTLTETDCVKYEMIFSKIIVPFLENLETSVDLLNLLVVLNELYLPRKLTNPKILIELVFAVLKQNRCDFFNYGDLNHSITRECVQFLYNCEECRELSLNFKENSIEQYYAEKICCNSQKSLFDFLFATESVENYYKFVCHLTQLLPNYVAEEWKEVALSLQSKIGTEKTLNALTDVLILLSTVAKTQTENDVVLKAYENCLNHYMVSVKNLKQSNIEDQITITRHVFRLLRRLPERNQNNAQVIIALMSDDSLKELLKSSENILGSMGDGNIAKFLNERISHLQ